MTHTPHAPLVTWSSSDPPVATVDSNGLVTAVDNGTATITATAGSVSATVTVTVVQVVSAVEVEPGKGTIVEGDTLLATVFDGRGGVVAGEVVEWSSSDPDVAAVNARGLVRGVTEGSATITAVAGKVRGDANLFVVRHPDRAALEALYSATAGDGWINNENWLTDAPLGDLYGVATDTNGRVTSLRLSENGLRGVLERCGFSSTRSRHQSVGHLSGQ